MAAAGQFRHSAIELFCQAVSAVEGIEVGARQRVQRGERFGTAGRGRGGALPGETLLFAGRGREERVVRFFAGFLFGLGVAGSERHVGDQPFGEQVEPQQRSGFATQGGLHGGRQQGAQGRVQVAGLEDPEQPRFAERVAVAASGAVVDVTLQRVLAQAGVELRDVAERIGGDVSAGSAGAELAEHLAQGLEGREFEGFRSFGRDDGVEHQRFDVLGVAFGVLERDLGAVGGAVEHELLVAERFAEGLDVLHRFLRRERPARWSELLGAFFEEPAGRAVGRVRERRRVVERLAAQRVRAAGAALVVDDQVAVVERRGDPFGQLAREWIGGLAGSAGEREHGARALRRSALEPLDVERDRAGRRAATVERDWHGRAREGRFVSARSEDEGRGRRRGAQHRDQRHCNRDRQCTRGGHDRWGDGGGALASHRRSRR